MKQKSKLINSTLFIFAKSTKKAMSNKFFKNIDAPIYRTTHKDFDAPKNAKVAVGIGTDGKPFKFIFIREI